MSILLPCLFCVALGLAFGGIHLLHGRMFPDDSAEEAKPSECSGMCSSCGFGCGMARSAKPADEGDRDA